MHTLLSVCQLCLLLLVMKTLAQDHRLRTPDGNEHIVRRKPKWSHFFVMHEPRSEEKDKAQGFFYQVGSGPPVINRLRSSPQGFQSQTGGSNMARYSPVLHSPYPNRQQPHQQFGSRMPDSFGPGMPNLPNPSLFNEPQVEDPTGGTLNSEISPDNVENFQTEPQEVPKQENLPNAPLQLDPSTLGDADSNSGTEILGPQGPVSSHTTLLLQGSPQHGAAPDDSSKDSLVPVKRKPSFVVGGQSVFGKRNPLHSHVTPLIPPATIELQGKTNVRGDEREKLRLSIAQHIPTRTENILPVLDQDHPESSGPGLSRPDSIAVTFLDPNRESQSLGAEIPEAQIAAGNDELREREITKDTPNKIGPEIKGYVDQNGNLKKTEQLPEIGRQSGTSAWQLQPGLNPLIQEGTPEIFFQDPGNGREREPISHDFTKPPYHVHEKKSNLPHLSQQQYDYLPVSQQHAQTNNAYHPPSLVNFNTNIHLHGGSPASPGTDLQKERPNQPSHSLSIHPYVLQKPESHVNQPALQKDVQTSDPFNGRIPSSQIYILRPSNPPELPLVITGHQNGPYQQDNRRHFGGEANSQTPSHLTSIFPVGVGHSKENVGQTAPQNVFSSNANQRAPNVEYSGVLLRNQPQDDILRSVNPPANIATHSIRLLLPQQQLPQFSPTNVPSSVPNVPGTPNRFQTHQVNLLPNSHGYVQTQVQLPPLNFRFQLTPVKDDSNGSFGDSPDSQKIGPTNFQPIPYQYQLPLQPVPIEGTHQILFPNLQVANVPQGTPSVPSDEDHRRATTASNGLNGLQEKPVTGSPVVEGTVDEAKTSKDQTKDDILENVKDNGSVVTVTDDETDVKGKGKLLETVSLPNNIPVKDETEKDTKEDTEIKSFTPDESKTGEKPTTESKNADIQLGSSVGSDEKEVIDISTLDGTGLELTTESQLPSTKPSLDLLSVLTFTEAPKPKDSVVKIDAKIAGDTELGEEKGTTASGDLESSSVSADDSGDGSSNELLTTDTNVPSAVITMESTTLEQQTDLANERSSELPTTVSEAPATVSTREFTTSEQSTVDLADKSGIELSTTISKAPTTISTRESTTLEQSTVDLADQSRGELSTTISEAPTTVRTREPTTFEQTTVRPADKSSSALTTEASEAPATVSTSESPIFEQERASTTKNELITDGVSESSGSSNVITGEDSTVPDINIESITSTSPGDTLFTTTNVPPSTDVTTVTVVGINDVSSTSKAEIVTELSETTSASTVFVLPSSSETVPTVPAQDATSDSATETSVFVAEPSTIKLQTEIVTTEPSSPAPAEDNMSSDQPSQTQPDLSTPISILGELETVTSTVSGPEPDQRTTEVSQSQTSTGSSVTTIKEIVSLSDLSSTTATATARDADAANEIEKLFTSPAQESSSPKVIVTTSSSDDKFSIFNQLSVFTFTEGPASKRKTDKTNGEIAGITPEEKLEENKTQTDSVSISKDTEVSLNEIFVVPTTTNAVEGVEDKEKDKRLRDEVVKDVNETSLEPRLKTTKRPEDRAIFTFVGKDISKTTKEGTEFPLAAVTPSTSTSTEDSNVATFTEKATEATTDNEIPLSTPSPETEFNQNQGGSVGATDLNETSDAARGLTEVLNGRERNENEVAEVESGRSSNRSTAEHDQVLSDTEITGLDDKETNDKSEKEQISTTTMESQNPSTLSSAIPESTDNGSFVITDSETSTDSKGSDPSVLETATNDSGNNQVTDTPMLIDNDALELLLNNLVTPRNISFLSPVTSTSISISIGIPSESPEQVLDENLSENIAAGQNNNVLGTGNSTAVKNEVQADKTDLPQSDNGSSFFSKVFGKSLLPFDNNQNPPEVSGNEGESQAVSTVSTEKDQSESSQENIQSQSSQTSSPSAIDAPSSDSVTSASVSPETEEPVPDRSSVKLTVLDNFEGKDVPDFTEILKQHAR